MNIHIETGKRRFSLQGPGLLLLCSVLFASLFCIAPPCGARVAAPPLLKQEPNRIANGATALAPFYEKLNLLKKGRRDRVTILHIGDSHIQAGSLTAQIRGPMQDLFGNAGRGLCFPYRLARSNGPDDYRITSNVIWDSARSVRADASWLFGLTGYAIRTDKENALLNISLSPSRCASSAGSGFDTVVVFHDKEPQAYDLSVTDVSGVEEARKDDLPGGDEEIASKFVFPAPVCRASMKTVKNEEDQNYARIYGISLERNSRGVLYHDAGVNGAVFEHFSGSQYFSRHVEFLKPDLVIISLGTNTAFGKAPDDAEIIGQIDRLYKTIKLSSPDSAVLFTTPPDAAAPRKKQTKSRVMKIRNLIAQYCMQQEIGYWDLYRVMGGYGSVSKWRKNKLVQPDMVHCTRAGYELQGRLLFEAIFNGYRTHESNRY